MVRRKNHKSDAIDSVNESLGKKKPSGQKPEDKFESSLEERVNNYLIKYQGERKDLREDVTIVLGRGGEELTDFIEDYQNNYKHSAQEKLLNKKEKTKTEVLLRPVSSKKRYNDSIK